MPQADRVVDILAGRPAGRRARHGPGLDPDAPRLEGRALLPARPRRVLLRRAPGRGAGDARQLRRRGPPPDRRLRRHASTGTVAASQGKGQAVELLAESVEVVGWVDDPDTLPDLAQAPHASSTCARSAHLRARTNTFGAVARVRHSLAMAIHRYFDEHGFYWIHTPILTASDAEGAGELFRVSTLDLANLPRTPEGAIDYSQDFFGKPAYLTVSGQLNVETYCLALTRVYTFGPTFRAENSNTSRHLSEFWMVEPEIAFADISRQRRPGRGPAPVQLPGASWTSAPTTWRSSPSGSTRRRSRRLEDFVKSSFARMEYTEAIEVLERSGRAFEFPVDVGRRPAGRARALPLRGVREAAGGGRQLPQGDQGVLHAPQRRRTHRGGDGRARARHRRDRRRQPARGAPRRARRADPRDGPRSRRRTGGTATCAATAPCRTPGSGWASTGPWPTPRAWRTSATSSRSRARPGSADF